MATLIKVDGSKSPVTKMGLEDMQALVGGWIELVHLPKGKLLVVNEEGLLMRLPVNPEASKLAGKIIVGDVIFATSKEVK